jgi:hypothetical protein
MQYTTLALGVAILIFSIYTLITSIKSPKELIKLKFMRDKLGHKAGTTVHTLAYVIVPLIFSYFIITAAIDGVTIQEFITGSRG